MYLSTYIYIAHLQIILIYCTLKNNYGHYIIYTNTQIYKLRMRNL